MKSEIAHTIERVINDIAAERNLTLPALRGDMELVDELGFSSLTVATLIAALEEALGVDPFLNEDVMITDIRTIASLTAVYENSLKSQH